MKNVPFSAEHDARKYIGVPLPGKNHPPLKGWRFAGFVGSIVAAVAVACYPIIISPYLYPEKWKQMSKEIREKEGIKQENIQPGGMKVWTDPFDRAGKPGNK